MFRRLHLFCDHQQKACTVKINVLAPTVYQMVHISLAPYQAHVMLCYENQVALSYIRELSEITKIKYVSLGFSGEVDKQLIQV